jgi:type IV secretory pathway TraG/TraD family ATPase VirD4
MYAQLFQYLERRPESHSAAGNQNFQTLLLMDEFARLGKLETIT